MPQSYRSYWSNRFGNQTYMARGSEDHVHGTPIRLTDRLVAIEEAAEAAGYPLTDIHRLLLGAVAEAMLALENMELPPGHPVHNYIGNNERHPLYMLAGAELELTSLKRLNTGLQSPDVTYGLFDYTKNQILALMQAVIEIDAELAIPDVHAIIDQLVGLELNEMEQIPTIVGEFLELADPQGMSRIRPLVDLHVLENFAESAYSDPQVSIFVATACALQRFPHFPDHFFQLGRRFNLFDIVDADFVELRFDHGDPLSTILHLFEMVAHLRQEFARIQTGNDHPAILLNGTHVNNSSWVEYSGYWGRLTESDEIGIAIADSQYDVLEALLPLMIADIIATQNMDVMEAMEWVVANQIVANGEYRLEKSLRAMKTRNDQGGVLHKVDLTEIREAHTTSQAGYNPLSSIFQVAASVLGFKQYLENPDRPVEFGYELRIRGTHGEEKAMQAARQAMTHALLKLMSEHFMELAEIHGEAQVMEFQQALSAHTGVDVTMLQVDEVDEQVAREGVFTPSSGLEF